MSLVIQSDRIFQYIGEILQTPIFFSSRDTMLSLMKFLDNVICSTPIIDKNLSKTMFMFFCEHMRSLYVEIRQKSINVFKRMNLRQIDEEMLNLSLKRETFMDYTTAMEKEKKNALPSPYNPPQNPNNVNNLPINVNRRLDPNPYNREGFP